MKERFRKELLIIEEGDTVTLQKLKKECNEWIEAYNELENPLNEQGQELTTRISFLLMKITYLKEVYSSKT